MQVDSVRANHDSLDVLDREYLSSELSRSNSLEEASKLVLSSSLFGVPRRPRDRAATPGMSRILEIRMIWTCFVQAVAQPQNVIIEMIVQFTIAEKSRNRTRPSLKERLIMEIQALSFAFDT